MTEYRLVPVEPTEEMIEAARPWPTHWGDRALASNEQKAAYLADHMTVASDYRAMLSAAPSAPTREAVARVIAPAAGHVLDGILARAKTPAAREQAIQSWFGREVLAKADAIISLMGGASAAVLRAKDGEA